MSDFSSFRSFPSSRSIADECLHVVRGFLHRYQSDQERSPRPTDRSTPDRHTHAGYDRNDQNDQSPQNRRERIARALLDDFVRSGDVHEVCVLGVPETLFIVPTMGDIDRLTVKGIGRARIWTPRELADVLRTNASSADFAAVALAKIAFDGDVVAVTPRRRDGGR